jgi:hypothetical protein
VHKHLRRLERVWNRSANLFHHHLHVQTASYFGWKRSGEPISDCVGCYSVTCPDKLPDPIIAARAMQALANFISVSAIALRRATYTFPRGLSLITRCWLLINDN